MCAIRSLAAAAAQDRLLVRLTLVSATGARAIGYESVQVGIVFATKSSVRENALHQALQDRLGAVANPREALPASLT